MSEIASLSRLEELYRELMGSDVATQQEINAKAEIISLLPQLKAVVLAEDTPEANEIGQQLESLYTRISKWNPLTVWFRDDDVLVQLYFDVLSKVRLFIIRQKGPSEESSTLVSESLSSLRQTISQLTPLLEEIRVSVKSILEIVSPTPEVHTRIASLSSRAQELEQRIAEFEASTGNESEADKAKIKRWKENLDKLNDQIVTLRKLVKQG
jgi:DNA repair exonuclease SbcCD ATPase subunit